MSVPQQLTTKSKLTSEVDAIKNSRRRRTQRNTHLSGLPYDPAPLRSFLAGRPARTLCGRPAGQQIAGERPRQPGTVIKVLSARVSAPVIAALRHVWQIRSNGSLVSARRKGWQIEELS